MNVERRVAPPNAAPAPPLQLVPKDPREAIVFMLKAFGEFPDELRIAMYLDLLADCTTEEIWGVVKVWSRQPHDRAAKAGELKDMIHTSRKKKAPVQLHEEQWERERITPEEKAEVIAGLTPKARVFLREACPWLFQGEH